MANIQPNQDLTSLTGITATTGVTISASSEGLRVRAAANRSDDSYVGLPYITATSAKMKLVLAYPKFRRNTAASGLPSVSSTFRGNFFEWGINQASIDFDDVAAPVGQWITSTGQLISPDSNTADNEDIRWGVQLRKDVAYDFTLTQMDTFKFGDSTTPARATLDSNDIGVSFTVRDDSLSVLITPDNLMNEGVTALITNTNASLDLVGYTFRPDTFTVSKAGIYDITVAGLAQFSPTEAYQSVFPKPKDVSKTYTMAIPAGEMEARFTHVIDYPLLTVDGSTSVAPTNAPVTKYTWSWGDGSVDSTGVKASHAYATAGTYNVKLKIENSGVLRYDEIQKTIVIASPPVRPTDSQFALGLFLDDPNGIVTPGATGLQAEMAPIIRDDNVQWNWTRNEPGTLKFKAPSTWLKDAVPGATLETLRSDLVVRLNFGAGWVEPPMGRMIVAEEAADPLNPQEMVDITCVLAAAADLGGLLFTPDITGKPYTSADYQDNYSRTYRATTAGALLNDIFPLSNVNLLKFLATDFATAVDSKSQAWDQTISNISFPPATNGVGVLAALTENGACDWYSQGGLLRAFNPGTSGKRGASEQLPELIAARDITKGPQTRTMRKKTYGAVVIPRDARPTTVIETDTTADSAPQTTYRGRRYVAIQSDGASSAAANLVLARPTLAELGRAQNGEMTRELKLYPGMPWMPYRDFWVGDYINAPGTNGKLVTVMVEGITIEKSSTAGYSATLTLGSAFAVGALQKKVNAIAGGGGVTVGTVGAKPPSSLKGFIQTLVSSKITVDNGEINAGNNLYLEGGGAAAAVTQFTLGNDGSPRIWSAQMYERTYASAANMIITSAGTIGRSTSASKYKINIKPYDFGDAILDLEPKTWHDKTAAEQLAESLHRLPPGHLGPEPDIDIPAVREHPGLIAEEVEALGLGHFVSYNDATGEVEGLQYDRLWVPLIPIIREQRARIDRLELAMERLLEREENR